MFAFPVNFFTSPASSNPLFSISDLNPEIYLNPRVTESLVISGSSITQINSLVENRLFSQPNSISQPQYDATGLNGFPCISVTGNQFLECNNNSGICQNVSGFTVGMLVTYSASSGVDANPFFISTATNNAFSRALIGLTSNKTRMGAGGRRLDNDSFIFQSEPLTLVNDQIYLTIVVFNYSQANVSCYVNGIRLFTQTFHPPGFSANTIPLRVAIGSVLPTSRVFRGNIGETFTVNRVLSDIEIDKVFGYWGHNWDALSFLPNDHPYKNNPPTLN